MTEDTLPAASQTETAPAAPAPEATSTLPETPEAPEAIVSALSEALQALAATREQAAALRAELEGHTKARTEMEAALAEARQALSAAAIQRAADAARYRDLLLAAHPQIPPTLVAGETIEAVEASLEVAQSTVEQVRQRLEAEGARAPIPAGAPSRRAPDLSALSAAEKIAYGLAARSREAG